jgi:hypothetical protein
MLHMSLNAKLSRALLIACLLWAQGIVAGHFEHQSWSFHNDSCITCSFSANVGHALMPGIPAVLVEKVALHYSNVIYISATTSQLVLPPYRGPPQIC